MTYNISSSNLQHPLLMPILKKLSAYFKGEDIGFYVIGATARDIIMGIHGEKARRATRDLDLAIAISDWKEYDNVEKGILAIEDFSKDSQQRQRFIYQGKYLVDIVPFGEIRKEDDKIFWPPDKSIAMSVLGFNEVQTATQEIIIDDNLTIEVASLDGIFILKLVAWIDRHDLHNRDADDMAFILNNYLSINEERAASNYYKEIYLKDDFSTNSGGAFLLGVDMGRILSDSPSTVQRFTETIESEIQSGVESKLVNQIIETNRNFSYEETILCLKNIIDGLIWINS